VYSIGQWSFQARVFGRSGDGWDRPARPRIKRIPVIRCAVSDRVVISLPSAQENSACPWESVALLVRENYRSPIEGKGF